MSKSFGLRSKYSMNAVEYWYLLVLTISVAFKHIDSIKSVCIVLWHYPLFYGVLF